MDARQDPGVVLWSESSNRWWSRCQVPGCKWQASHDNADVAVSAMRRHLIKAHVASATDTRTDSDGLEHSGGRRLS